MLVLPSVVISEKNPKIKECRVLPSVSIEKIKLLAISAILKAEKNVVVGCLLLLKVLSICESLSMVGVVFSVPNIWCLKPGKPADTDSTGCTCCYFA